MKIFKTDEFRLEVDSFQPADLNMFSMVLGEFIDLTKIEMHSNRCDFVTFEKHCANIKKEEAESKDPVDFQKFNLWKHIRK